MKPTVVIETPYAANKEKNLTLEGNLKYLDECLMHSINNGEAPFAGHLIYPRVLKDDDPIERGIGIFCHLSFIPHATALTVYVDNGISTGMQEGIRAAIENNIVVIFRSIREDLGRCQRLHEKYMAAKQTFLLSKEYPESEAAFLSLESWNNIIKGFGEVE